jgi:hypothetical protein
MAQRQERPPQQDDSRRAIARLVLWPSFAIIVALGLFIMAANFAWDWLIFAHWIDPHIEQRAATPGFRDAFDKVFGTVLPVVSAWVGAVLSYYFAQKNFETGSQTTREAIAALPLSEVLRRIPVADKMKPYSAIDAVHAHESADGRTWDNPLSEIREIFERSGRSRAPVFFGAPKGSGEERVECVVHESVFYRFLDHARESGRDLDALTLENLLEDSEVARRVSSAVAFVSKDATLAQAKAAMDATPGCQDVFVTVDGRADGAVVGWLTNVDVLRYSIAGAS